MTTKIWDRRLTKGEMDFINNRACFLFGACGAIPSCDGCTKRETFENDMGIMSKPSHTEDKSGKCMLLGGYCYKECPHYYYRKTNGCFKPEEVEEECYENPELLGEK